jgi:hypothetical protein
MTRNVDPPSSSVGPSVGFRHHGSHEPEAFGQTLRSLLAWAIATNTKTASAPGSSRWQVDHDPQRPPSLPGGSIADQRGRRHRQEIRPRHDAPAPASANAEGSGTATAVHNRFAYIASWDLPGGTGLASAATAFAHWQSQCHPDLGGNAGVNRCRGSDQTIRARSGLCTDPVITYPRRIRSEL